MRKVRHATARVFLPSLFDLPKKTPPPPPEVAAELILLLERLLLGADPETETRAAQTRRDTHE